MDLMKRRRGIIASQQGLDTSPKIVEYDKYLERDGTATGAAVGWCYTEWILFDPQRTGMLMVVDNCTQSNRVFQYQNEQGSYADYWYGPERIIGNADVTLYKIRFSIETAKIDDSYAYCETTGQIMFAGKNTQYYGHRNISELS